VAIGAGGYRCRRLSAPGDAIGARVKCLVGGRTHRDHASVHNRRLQMCTCRRHQWSHDNHVQLRRRGIQAPISKMSAPEGVGARVDEPRNSGQNVHLLSACTGPGGTNVDHNVRKFSTRWKKCGTVSESCRSAPRTPNPGLGGRRAVVQPPNPGLRCMVQWTTPPNPGLGGRRAVVTTLNPGLGGQSSVVTTLNPGLGGQSSVITTFNPGLGGQRSTGTPPNHGLGVGATTSTFFEPAKGGPRVECLYRERVDRGGEGRDGGGWATGGVSL